MHALVSRSLTDLSSGVHVASEDLKSEPTISSSLTRTIAKKK